MPVAVDRARAPALAGRAWDLLDVESVRNRARRDAANIVSEDTLDDPRRDWIDPAFASDNLFGGAEADTSFNGGAGADYLSGDTGNDSFFRGGSGQNSLFGGSGKDIVFDGGSGSDFKLYGGSGADSLFGDSGADLSLNGRSGNDHLFGGAGDDNGFSGNEGDDSISGGEEVVAAFLWCEGAGDGSDGAPEPIDAALGSLAQEGFELGKGLSYVRQAWAQSCRCKSHHELVTASEAKRNGMRLTECGEEAWSEAAGRWTRTGSKALRTRASGHGTVKLS